MAARFRLVKDFSLPRVDPQNPTLRLGKKRKSHVNFMAQAGKNEDNGDMNVDYTYIHI